MAPEYQELSPKYETLLERAKRSAELLLIAGGELSLNGDLRFVMLSEAHRMQRLLSQKGIRLCRIFERVPSLKMEPLVGLIAGGTTDA